MFQTFRENFRRHTLLRDAVFIVIGSAIVFNPGAFFQFVGYLIAGYLMLLGLINIYDDYKIKKQTGRWSCFSFQPLQKSLSFDASLWNYPDFHGCH